MKTVYDYSDYKAYLKAFLASQAKKGHGLKSIWAKGIGCQSAYLSRVLNQDAHLSMEQADQLPQYLALSDEEGRFFLLLVQLGRAGTHSLKTRLKKQIDEILQKRELLRNRVDIKDRLSEEAQIKYYSSWHYAALHISVTIERLQSKQALAEHFKLSIDRVTEVLDFLESIQLVKAQGTKYVAGKNRLFLGSDSDLISKHHTNWRIKAIESFDDTEDQSVHLSTIFTMAKPDYKKVKEILLKAIDEARAVVKDTKKEEEVVCFNLDLFRL